MSVPLIGPDGRRYEIDEGPSLDRVLKLGFRVETPEAPQTTLESAVDFGKEAVETASAATMGGLRGVTVGLSDPALALTNPEAAQTLKGMEEAHPVTSTLGELAGMVASPLNAPGNALTKGIGATTRLGRIGANMAGGSVSGLLFGAGKTVSEAALGDVDLTAQKLVAGAGLGGLLGLAGGGVGGLIEEGARAVLPSLRALAGRAGGALDDIANDATIAATRAKQGAIDRLGEDKVRAAVEVIRSRGHLKQTPKAIGESIAKDRGALAGQLGKVIDDLDAAGARPDYMKALRRLDDFETGLNSLERDSIASDLAAARRELAKLGEEGAGFRGFDKAKKTLQERAKFNGPAPVDNQALRLKRSLAGVVRDELDQQIIPAVGTDAGKAFIETKATYGALRDAEKLAASGAKRAGGFSMADLASAVIGAGMHPLGLGAALGSKVMREQGPAIVARIADRLAKEPALSAMAKSFTASLPATSPRLGQYGALLAQEAQHSPERALATHVAMAQLDPSYAATAQLAGLTPELPDEHAASLGRAQALADARAAAAAHDRAITEALDGVVKGKAPAASSVLKSQDFGAKRMRQASQEAHRRRVDEVRQLASDPQALLDRVSKNLLELGQVAPAVSASMTATADRAVKYLAKAAEVPPKPGPLAREWTPTAAERHTFALKLEAVQQPMSILQHAARGTLTRQQVDAVRAVYPQFAMELEQKALERLVSGEAIPYRARLMLSVLTGVDPDGTLSARSISMNQQAIANAQGKPSERGPAPQQDVKMGQAERMALPGEKRQLGREEA